MECYFKFYLYICNVIDELLVLILFTKGKI